MTSLIEIKKQKWIGIIFCIILLVLSTVFGIQKAGVASNRLAVHFIDVGQGDSILVSCGTHYMMVDFGNNSMGTKIQYYLQTQGVEKLDYAVGTHPDADHIGGMDVILYKFAVDKVFLPDVEVDTATYRDVVDTCREKDYEIEHPEAGTEYKLGAAKFTVLSPAREYPESNDNSIVIRLEYKDTSFLFMGDASEMVENDLLESGVMLQSDVIKLGHHGSKYSSSKKFLKAVDADYAVISCGKDNSYGHPHKEVMKRLKSLGVKQFRTDKQGTVIVTTDGKKLSWEAEPSNDYSHGKIVNNTRTDEKQENGSGNGTNHNDADEVTDVEATYILNTNTSKFHLTSCPSVEDMSDKNKEAVNWTREKCIQNGYEPCKRCNP